MVIDANPVRKVTMPNDLQLDSDRVATVEVAPASRVNTPTERYRAERKRTAEVSSVPDPVPDLYAATSDGLQAAGVPERQALPPLVVRRSGIYRLVPGFVPPIPAAPTDGNVSKPSEAIQVNGPGAADLAQASAVGPVVPSATLFGTEELRVDVDGLLPTMTVSGTINRLFSGQLTWIARVTKDPVTGAWTGPISYRDGKTSLRPQAKVSVTLTGPPFLPLSRRAIATFSGGSGASVTLNYIFEKTAFRELAFEHDTVSDATAVTAHNPSSHPNHSASAPNTTLSLESAYARVGIQVTKTGGDSVIPMDDAGPNTTWSEQEMHDAMQAHWSRWADAPQWAVWVLFARLHDQGTSLGGIMFDDIGTAQRQGTAIFSDSFISHAPSDEANPGPWVERMKFWTAMHEIGHTFNLAHSWQKSLGTSWVPLADEPSALSYMNYPFRYPGGLDAFFAAFEYEFSPDELLFLRHAPERLVKQGAEPWFSNHGFEKDAFEQLRAAVTSPLELELRLHREPRFEFLEPVVIELKLKNVSSTPAIVDANALKGDGLAIVVAKKDGDAKRWLPLARYCTAPSPMVLQPTEAIYGSIFLSAGTGGWLISDPGMYTVYAATETGAGSAALSRPLTIVVDPPWGPESERLASDVFTKGVAHALAFGGSRVLEGANEILKQVAEQLPQSKAAVHATAVLGTPMAADGKVLTVTGNGKETVKVVPAAPSQARELLSAALRDFDMAADSLGHITITEQTRRLGDLIAAEGDTSGRDELLNQSADALARRGVLPGVVETLRP
jgi:hypothetical protein